MVVIVDYGLGNLFSVAKAFEALGKEVKISGRPADLHSAERIVLPGIGAFGDGMKNLAEHGLVEALKTEVLVNRKPFLGICLGMQLLGSVGEEFGPNPGLNFIPGKVPLLPVEKLNLKLPHIGWNDVAVTSRVKLFDGIKPNSDFYFLHSFELLPDDQSVVVATASYGVPVVAAVLKDNIFATQFHPEKSQANGLKLLSNWLNWTP